MYLTPRSIVVQRSKRVFFKNVFGRIKGNNCAVNASLCAQERGKKVGQGGRIWQLSIFL